MKSESPYSRHGRPQEVAAPTRRAEIHGARSPFELAHQALGDWRRWRDILELEGIDDPFDLEALELDGEGASLLRAFEDLEGGDPIEVDLSADTGVYARILARAGHWQGVGVVSFVETLEGGERVYTLGYTAPGEEIQGPTVTIPAARFDTPSGGRRALRVWLTSDGDRAGIELELDDDLLFHLWAAQPEGLKLKATTHTTRHEVRLP